MHRTMYVAVPSACPWVAAVRADPESLSVDLDFVDLVLPEAEFGVVDL